ncbi:MAG: hypothetical protein IAB19_02580, partial [Proteobacteria bacterium]|nr:hypothetical protein [Candidatus Avisuccinivibrio stercorigallinarum]
MSADKLQRTGLTPYTYAAVKAQAADLLAELTTEPSSGSSEAAGAALAAAAAQAAVQEQSAAPAEKSAEPAASSQTAVHSRAPVNPALRLKHNHRHRSPAEAMQAALAHQPE